MSLNVYLAAPYAAKETIRGYANELEDLGFGIQCGWLTSEGQPGNGVELALADRQRAAIDCLVDVNKAHVVVVFTARALFDAGAVAAADASAPILHTGGRHVETGYALAHRRRVLLVGEPENIFGWNPSITIASDWHVAVVTLGRWLVQHERDQPQAMEIA